MRYDIESQSAYLLANLSCGESYAKQHITLNRMGKD